jgi:hypothetical protein
MNKITKTTIQFFLAVTLFASFAVSGCNNEGEKAADAHKDSMSAPAPATMEAAPVPAAPDTMLKRDTLKTRPTPGGS